MPPKLQPDENLLFLFTCLQTVEFKNMDFHAVAAALNITENAARKRFTRLRKAIEDSQGSQPAATPIVIPAAVPAAKSTKRKKDQAKAGDGVVKKVKVEEGVDEVKGGGQGETF